jgi:hypothetical protein
MQMLDALQVMDTCGEGYPAKVGSMYIDRWTGTLSSHEDREIQAWISPLPGIGGIADLSKHPLRHYDVNFMRKEPAGKSIYDSNFTMRMRVHRGDVYPFSPRSDSARPECVRFVHLFNLLRSRATVWKVDKVLAGWEGWLWPTVANVG